MSEVAVGVVVYFGERWDSPFFDAVAGLKIIHRDVPVGVPCYWCEDLIVEGERGLFRPVVRPSGSTVEPIHAECGLREALGSFAHLNGLCSCFGQEEPPFPGTKREEALAVLALVNRVRIQQMNIGPLW